MVKIDTKSFEEAMGLFSAKSLAFAVKRGLDNTAEVVRDRMRESAKNTFDPSGDGITPYTRNSIVSVRSLTDTLVAQVKILDQSVMPNQTVASKYLEPQIYGTKRRQKRFEKALVNSGILASNLVATPVRVGLDRYGNVTGDQIVRILSGLKAFDERGFQMNATDRSQAREMAKLRRRAMKAQINPMNVFTIPAYGIFQQVKGEKRPRMLFKFTEARPYKAKWDFEGIATKETIQAGQAEMLKALMQEIFEKLTR